MARVEGSGPYKWKLTRDNDTEREYKATYRVKVTSREGLYAAMTATGLPAVGSSWNYHDLDSWALCLPEREIEPAVEGEETGFYWVTCTFSTKPFTRCAATEKGNPLLEPIKITGSFQKYTKEVWQNYDGTPITSSSHEYFHGQNVEFDFNRPSVKIEMNAGLVQQNLIAQFVDCVNSTPMWGVAARCVKLSNCSWERLFYGSCSCYFRWSLEFDIDFNSFDRFVADEGTKVLRGQWRWIGSETGTRTNADLFVWNPDLTADKNNPKHFVRYQDCFGNPARVMLDGQGNPAEAVKQLGTGTSTSTAGQTTGQNARIPVRHYPGVNFALLGIPTTLTCTS